MLLGFAVSKAITGTGTHRSTAPPSVESSLVSGLARASRPGALAELVRSRINPELPLIEQPLPADDPLQRQPVIELATRELGWQPTVPLEQGLEPTIAYFREAIG